MRLLTDVSVGEWLAARIGGWARVGGVAGTGFEAYARILHPVPVYHRTLEDTQPLGTRWPWAEVARRQSLTMHPLVQWNRLADIHQGIDFDDGWRVGQTEDGYLAPDLLAALTEHLAAATSTPEDLVVGIWPGWGDFPVSGPEDLVIPGREYTLFASDLVELADPGWPYRAGIGWTEDFPGPMPQLIWPADHAWVVASEIDWDSTIVAGSQVLVEAVLADDRFEAYEVDADADLSWEGDRINPPRAGWREGP